MKTFEATVNVQNGVVKIAHVVRIPADNVFSAQQLLQAQYGASNVVTIPVEVNTGASYDPAPWLIKY